MRKLVFPFGRILVAASIAVCAAGGARAAPPAGGTIFRDTARGIEVHYDFTPAGIEFSARLPDEWSFTVNIDGNQDGKWGNGPESDSIVSRQTEDRAYSKESRGGSFCPQYILSWISQDPTQSGSSSICGGYPSKGSVEMWAPDAQDRATMTLKIPLDEVFGKHADAHVQICVWDTHSRTCQFTPAKPFVLRRPAMPAR
jgi:hypothetical protein